MEIPKELDDFIKNTVDHTVGLTVPNSFLQIKIESLETTNHRLRGQYLSLLSQLQFKETALARARAESSMNAQAIRKFVEENGKLANECRVLVEQCKKWEEECNLYDHDRESLMDFGNEADERARDAEVRVNELEEELKRITDELKYYKHQYESLSVDSSVDGPPVEKIVLDALVASLVNKKEAAKTASAFLEENSEVEMCHELLKMRNSLRPETQNVLSLASLVTTLKKDKEHLRINLHRAEEEVNALAEENSVLLEENKRLVKLCHSERKRASSGEKLDSSARAKSNKRRTSPGMSSPVDRKIDFNDLESLRHPLSPLKENSPDPMSQKK